MQIPEWWAVDGIPGSFGYPSVAEFRLPENERWNKLEAMVSESDKLDNLGFSCSLFRKSSVSGRPPRNHTSNKPDIRFSMSALI